MLFSNMLDCFIGRHDSLASQRDRLAQSLTIMADCLAAGGKLLVCGNGGSAADAEHIVGS